MKCEFQSESLKASGRMKITRWPGGASRFDGKESASASGSSSLGLVSLFLPIA